MKTVSRLAGLAAITHISFFPLLDAHFRNRVKTDALFSVQALMMGYYSEIMCGPDSAGRPHSPYHRSVACHAFTFSTRRRECGCDSWQNGEVGMDGLPADNSHLLDRDQVTWGDWPDVPAADAPRIV